MKHTICIALLLLIAVKRMYAQQLPTLAFEEGHPGGVDYIMPSKDGNFVYAVGGGYCKKWNLASGQVDNSFAVTIPKYQNILIVERLQLLIAVIDQHIHVFDLETGRRKTILKDYIFSNVVAMDCNPSLSQLSFSGKEYNSIFIWDLQADRLVKEIKDTHAPGTPTTLRYSPDGNNIVFVAFDDVLEGKELPHFSTIKLYNVNAGTFVKNIAREPGSVIGVKFSGNGKVMASFSFQQGTINLWRGSDFTSLGEIKANYCWDMDINAAGTQLVTAAGAKLMRYNIPPGLPIDTIGFPGRENNYNYVRMSLHYLTDDGYLIAGYDHPGDNLALWNLSAKKAIELKNGLFNSDLIKTSATGRYFITAGSDNVLRLWSASSGDLIQVFAGHRSTIFSVAFSKDDHFLISGDREGYIMIWDVTTILPAKGLF